MNYLQGTVKTIPSYEVAEMMEREHKYVLRTIEGTERVKGIIPTLESANLHPQDFFILSTYKAGTKEYKCYECTKMGCELLANKMTGEKGILFSARYVEKFNAMEQGVQNIEALVVNCLEKVLPSMIGTMVEKLVPMLNPPTQEIKVDKGKEEFRKRLYEIKYILKTAGTIGEFYSMGAYKLNEILKDQGFIVKNGNDWDFASEYKDKGYGEVYGGSYAGKYIKYTDKGCFKIYELLKGLGYLPNWEGER